MAVAETTQIETGGIVVDLRRSLRARRFTLTVPQTGGPPRLTAPRGASLSDARMFLMRQEDWLRAAVARTPEVTQVRDGADLPVAGALLTLRREDGRGRARIADGALRLAARPGREGAAAAAFLKARAREALAPAALSYAAQVGRKSGRLTLRDTSSRWGSCSSKGDLMFSWRLAMAPPEVLDYVAAHEAAHLVEMNHGPRFWALVERIRPDYRPLRTWLRENGADLMRYRFTAES